MREFSVHPKAQSNLAKNVFFALLGSALLILVASYISPMFNGLISFAAMICIVAAVYIYSKYIGADYYYDITESEGAPLLVIRHKVGKRNTTLCRLDIASIVSVTPLTRSELKAKPQEKDILRFTYCPTMCAQSVYLISSRSRYEQADIVIEGTDELADLLMQIAAECRTSSEGDEY